MSILKITRDFNPKKALTFIFDKIDEILGATNDNTSAIAALPVQPKVYKALLTQSGTNAPVATVLVNTLSGTPVWSYDSAGAYFLTLASEFTAAKTSYNITVNSSVNDIFTIQRINDDYFYIATASLTAGTYVSADDFLVNTPITIEVYP